MKTIGQQLIEAFNQLGNVDFTNMPTVLFMSKLRRNLISDGFESAKAESIISCMSIELTSEYSDDELNELADILCSIIKKLKNAFDYHGFDETSIVLQNVAKAFILKG